MAEPWMNCALRMTLIYEILFGCWDVRYFWSMKWNTPFLFVGLLTIGASTTQAQEIVTDRPDQTESAAIVPLGMLQYEGGLLVEWSDFMQSERDWLIPNTLLRLPVSESVELRLVHNRSAKHLQWEDRWEPTLTDIEVGVKWNLLDGSQSGTMLAVLSHWALPTSANQPELASSHKLCLSHDVGPDWALGYNVGALWSSGLEGFMYTFAVGRSLGKGWSIYVEPYGEWTEAGGHLASFDAGFTWLASDRVQWDWSFAKGLNHEYGYQALGLSWLLGD